MPTGVYKRMKHSEETKKKISKSLLGRHHSKETKAKISKAHKGKCFSEKHKRNLSKAQSGMKKPWVSKQMKEKTGKKSSAWKGGITPENLAIRSSTKMKEWRKTVFERDGYTCQVCRNVGGYLNAHHIKSFAHYPKLRFDINNGVTLCRECHLMTGRHKGIGKKKNG